MVRTLSKRRSCQVIFVLALAVATASCKRQGCDPSGLEKVQALLASKGIDPSLKATIAAEGIGEACAARLPKGIANALRGIATPGIEPAMRATIVMEGLEQEPTVAQAGCPKFKETFAGMAAVAPESRAGFLYTGCEYEKLGLLTAAEFETSSNLNFPSAMVAPPLYKWLIENGVDQAEAKGMVRIILGL